MSADQLKIIAIVPARGGSKSIPRKNILPVLGKPLIAWPIELARSIKEIDRVIVSSDDAEIMETAKKHGAEVLFKRPAELALDETPTLPVLQHCLNFLKEKENYQPDIVCLLYPTSPLLKKERVKEALEKFKDKNCNTVISVEEDKGHFWKKEGERFVPFFPKERKNRQYVEPLYRENGAIYFNRFSVIMEQNKIVDEENADFIVMNPGESVDLDEAKDLNKITKKHV